MSPDQYCQDKAAKSGSSFYYSLLFIPAEQRRVITALYAFCREVSNVVDECSEHDVARHKLDWWREEIERGFSRQARHPITRALEHALQDYNLPVEYFHEIIDGMTMDLEQSRYDSFSELSLYCHRVAGMVGLLSAEIFGYRNRDTLKFAQELGMALQLTRIIRDVREDAVRGRIYLPLDEMLEYRINPHDLLLGTATDNLQALLAFQAQRARQHYQRALSRLPVQDRYAQRSSLIMGTIYQTLLDEMEADNFQVMQHRIRLTPLRKLWIAWQVARRERRRHRRQLKHPVHV